ncbi:MAG: hypothetical protein LJE56_09065 [Acidiferrobacterales bacterium]|jgi:hypothetical protein|nr:hypothetical protein [Acidiferrobacterales bacterium]
MKFVKGVVTILVFSISAAASAGALDMLKAAKTANEGYGAYQSGQTIAGMENAKPIFTGVKRVYVVSRTSPGKGSTGAMNVLVEKVVCDNIDRIVDNLDDYDMEGAEPKCSAGMPSKASKKKEVLMLINQTGDSSSINLTVEYKDRASNETLKTLTVAPAENYYIAVSSLIDDLHNDMVISSRTNNPLTLKKWPKRFSKYSKKKKHREVDMKRKEKKQLEANEAK